MSVDNLQAVALMLSGAAIIMLGLSFGFIALRLHRRVSTLEARQVPICAEPGPQVGETPTECVLPAGHKTRWHRDHTGRQWTPTSLDP